MADFTLSGDPLFEGSNPFDAAVLFSGSLVANTEVSGLAVGTSEFEGGINVSIGASDTPAGGTGLLLSTASFPTGTLSFTIALFDAEEAELQPIALLGGALDFMPVGGPVEADFGALPVLARAEFGGSLTVQAEVSDVVLDAAAEFDGFLTTTFFIGFGDVAGNELLDVTPTVTGEPIFDILQSPPYVFFDGVDDYLFHANTADAALNGGAAFSVAFIVDPEIVNNGASGTILGKHDPSSTNHGWRVEWNAVTGLVGVGFASNLDGTNTVSRPNTTAIRTRTAVVITYDGATINIYLTGVGLDNGTQTGTAGNMVTNAAEFAIGAHDTVSGATNFFRGAVCGVWVWDLVLSGAEAGQVDPYGEFNIPQPGNLQAQWRPWDIHSTGFNEFFANWIDNANSRALQPAAGLNAKPLVLPSALTEIMLFSDVWDTDFLNTAELYGLDQNLASDYPLSSDPLDASEDGRWRLFTPPTQQAHPVISDSPPGYRPFRSDITIFVRIRNPAAFSDDVTLVELRGLRLFLDTADGSLALFVGDTGTPTRHLYGLDFPFGDGVAALVALRYNSVTGLFSLHYNSGKILPISDSVTGTAPAGDGLQLCDNADYGEAFTIASCLPDVLIQQVLNGFAGDVRGLPITAQRFARQLARRVPNPDLIWGGVLVPSSTAFPEEVGFEPKLLFTDLPARGTLELSGQPNDGDQFVLDDGEGNTETFEFESGGGVSPGAVAVTVGALVGDTLDNLVTALNGSSLNITAATRTDFDDIGDGTPSGAYTLLTHGTVPADDQDFSTEVAITVTNGSGNLIATGMRRPVAAVDRFDAIARALFDVRDMVVAATHWPFTDAPYIVTEITLEDAASGTTPPFVNPLPTIVSVTVGTTFNVTAIANAGPTDAGDVRSWWEVEMATGNTETFVRIDEADNNFSQQKNHTDSFVIPAGLNFDQKRIRFVIQSQVDPDQIWATLFFRMEGDGFNNGETEVIILPAPSPPAPPPTIDLDISLEQQAFVVAEEEQAARALLRLSNRSRYKLTRAFTNSRFDPRISGRNLGGFEFGLMSVLADFETAGTTFQVHRVRQQDIGFLDLLAVRFYGQGFEDFWWAIAYVNTIIDPELEMFVGQELVIPPREAVTTFLTRKPGARQGRG